MTTTDTSTIGRGRSQAFHMSADSAYELPAAPATVFANEASGTRKESR